MFCRGRGTSVPSLKQAGLKSCTPTVDYNLPKNLWTDMASGGYAAASQKASSFTTGHFVRSVGADSGKRNPCPVGQGRYPAELDDITAYAATISSLRSDWSQKRRAFLTPLWSTYRVRSSVASRWPISTCSSA